jgi:uncharacterized membrane protein YccF (DUF307 family)
MPLVMTALLAMTAPSVMTVLLVMRALVATALLTMTTLLTMTALLIMKHSLLPSGKPTILKNQRASTRKHTQHRQWSTAIQNRTTSTLLPLMYPMLPCLY